MSTIHIHIGRAKTGTTSIQGVCHGNKPLLSKMGFVYPASAGKANHVPMACAFSRNMTTARKAPLGITDAASQAAFRKKFEKAFAAEVAANPGKDFVSSSEHYAPLMDAESIADMKAFLSQFFDRVRIVFYSRNPVDWVISFYQTEVRNGRKVPFNLERDFTSRSDRELVEPWIEAFGRDNVDVRFFSRSTLTNGDIVDDFCGLVGIDPKPLVRKYHENKTLDQKSLEILRLINKLYPDFLERAPMARKTLMRQMEKVASGDKAQLSRRAADMLYDMRANDLKWISKQTGVPMKTIKKTSRICEGDNDMRSVKATKADALDMLMQVLPDVVRPLKTASRPKTGAT